MGSHFFPFPLHGNVNCQQTKQKSCKSSKTFNNISSSPSIHVRPVHAIRRPVNRCSARFCCVRKPKISHCRSSNLLFFTDCYFSLFSIQHKRPVIMMMTTVLVVFVGVTTRTTTRQQGQLQWKSTTNTHSA